MVKKVNIPKNPFANGQPGAIDRLTGGGPKLRNSPVPKTEPIADVPMQQSSEADQIEKTKTAGRQVKPTSVYFSDEHLAKLMNLEIGFWQRYKKKINRNDILRYLLEQCDIDSLQGLAFEEQP